MRFHFRTIAAKNRLFSSSIAPYWCTACRKQLNEIRANYDRFTGAGAEVVALSTDDLGPTKQLVEGNGYDFPIVYTSADNTIPNAYDRFDKFGDGLASAAIFIIGADGRIAWEDLNTSPYDFTRAATVLTELENL